MKRVLIVDWDVHHGNGTQRMFESDPSVLYFSVHRHDNGKFYPGGDYGGVDSAGSGAGLGYSINVPWDLKASRSGPGDAEYAAAFTQILLPIAHDFAELATSPRRRRHRPRWWRGCGRRPLLATH